LIYNYIILEEKYLYKPNVLTPLIVVMCYLIEIRFSNLWKLFLTTTFKYASCQIKI